MMLDPLSILFIIVAIGFIVLFVLLPRYGPHYSSRLTCPNCRKSFNFHWIPGATITSIVYRGRRNLKCPYCHVKSNYDIMNTRVRTPKKASKAKTKA
jgi:hypothetical protein